MDFLTSSEKIERIFEKYFQKTIILSIKDYEIKKGKFLLLKNCIISNNYFYELTIERAKKLDVVRIPYPFDLDEYEDENLLYMDYRLTTLFKNDKASLDSVSAWVKKIDTKNTHKFFDNILEIKFE
jgi:hypothetical protein